MIAHVCEWCIFHGGLVLVSNLKLSTTKIWQLLLRNINIIIGVKKITLLG